MDLVCIPYLHIHNTMPSGGIRGSSYLVWKLDGQPPGELRITFVPFIATYGKVRWESRWVRNLLGLKLPDDDDTPTDRMQFSVARLSGSAEPCG